MDKKSEGDFTLAESRARYFSLIITAAEAVGMFLLFGLVTFGVLLWSVERGESPGLLILFWFIFLYIGVFIVLSVFYKAFYHILTASVFVLLVLLFFELSVFCYISAVMGGFIVLSVLNKKFLHKISTSVFPWAVLLLLILPAAFYSPIGFVVLLILFAPQIYYYIVRIKLKKAEIRGT